MSRYNSSRADPRDEPDSDSEMNYITADSRRTSETSGFYDAEGRRRTAGVPDYHAPSYPRYRTTDSMSPSSDARSSPVYFDEPGPSGRVLNFDGGSQESLSTTGNYSELDPSTSTGVRSALDSFNTKPIDKIQHYTQMGEYVKELYMDRGMADVLIKIDEETFPTHRIALASQSAYFSNLFLNEVSNTRLKLPLEIRIKGIDPEAFRAFLTYIYTGELNVPPKLVSDFLYMCSKLRCQGLVETWQELLKNMTPEQALVLVDKVPESGPLYKQAFNLLLQKFKDLPKYDRYYRLSPGTMCKLLMHDHLDVRSELEAFEEAQKWLSKAVDLPRDTEVRLLRRIRYSLMTPKDLFYVCKKSSIFKTDPVCKEMVLRANWLHTQQKLGLEDGINVSGAKPRTKMPADSKKEASSPVSESGISAYGAEDFPVPKVGGLGQSTSDFSVDDDIIGDRLSPRHGRRDRVTVGPHSTRHCGGKDGFLTGDILAVGGSQRRSREHRSGRHVQRYSSEKNKWMQFAPLPEHRQNHAVAIFGGKLYLTGGCETDGSRRLSTRACNRVFVFDTEETVWQEVASMRSKRRCHALCPLFGKLYALGGQDEWGRVLNTVERYNPHDNHWEFLTPMRHARLGAGAAVFRGFLFVVGGYGDEGALRRGLPILSIVECYDPRIHKWTMKYDMRIPRCYCNLVCCNQRLYVFGGAAEIHGMLQSVGSVDLYDPRADEWEHVANLQTPRHNSGSAVIGNKIYIIGGVCSKEHNQVLQSIECYNAGTGFWEPGVEPLPHPAKSVGCAVLPVVSK